MDDKAKIIAKIKKCLALAKSSNEHEAQAALSQAQKLMAMHGVTEGDVHASEAEEHRTRAGAKQKPSRWETHLATAVGQAFGCRLILSYEPVKDCGLWLFIGCAPSAEIAKYAFEVVFRQCKRARAGYIKTKLKRCGAATRTRRADSYCEGWVHSATRAINAFAGTEEQLRTIECFIAAKHPSLSSIKPTDRNAGRNLSVRDLEDRTSGFLNGRNAEINRGVAGSTPSLLEG